MAGERTKLLVSQRETLGSAETRRLRKSGFVPGVLYGSGEPVAICVESRELRRALTGAAGLHSILDVEIDGKGKTHASILKEYQVDPVRGGVTHIDLQEVRLDQTINASVSVNLIGGDDAPGVKRRRRPLAGAARGHGRGAAARGSGAHRLRRLDAGDRRHTPSRRALRSRRRHDPRRDGVGRRHDHGPDEGSRPEPTEEELAAAEADAEGEGAEGEGGEEAPADAEAEASGDEAPAEE